MGTYIHIGCMCSCLGRALDLQVAANCSLQCRCGQNSVFVLALSYRYSAHARARSKLTYLVDYLIWVGCQPLASSFVSCFCTTSIDAFTCGLEATSCSGGCQMFEAQFTCLEWPPSVDVAGQRHPDIFTCGLETTSLRRPP